MTSAPPAGAGAASVTVPTAGLPPGHRRRVQAQRGQRRRRAGLTVKVVVALVPLYDAVSVAAVVCATTAVAMPKVAAFAPCATVALAGTVTAELALDMATTAPPAGAAAVSVTVPVDALPPATGLGLALSAATDG